MPEILHVGPSLAPVAILIPAYNAATYLAQAIESVLRQTHRDFDLLILDDASTDNTQEVARRYLADPRVSYLRNERNLGMSANWNKGLSILRNEFIAKLDADDYYEPGFLAEVLPVFENDLEVGLVFTGVNWISSEERDVLFYTNKWVCEGRSFLQNLLRLCVLFSPTICVRRQCYSRLGGFLDKMRIHSDWEMWIRICCHSKVGYVNKVLATYRKHSANCTAASKTDSRTPDDFAFWLGKLDRGELPYTLAPDERKLLEQSMVLTVRSLLYATLFSGGNQPALACAQFLAARLWIPWWERMRYQALITSLCRLGKPIRFMTRGRGFTESWWKLEDCIRMQLPANDPMAALTVS